MEVDILNIPKLRFKEFTDEWVYYKYKDIFNLNQGLQIPITERFLDYAPNRFFYITNEFLKPSSKKSYYIENPSPNVICTKEDILMTRTGNTGKVITNIAGVFHNNFFRIKYNPKNFNKDFICCILNQNKIQNKILTLAGNSTIPDLNHKDFYSIKSRFPKLKEQEKIAKFINTVDKKIENIENTISSLENQKKGLLQQIFSQKLRFKDENGNNYPNWKENIESIKILSGNMYPTTSYINKPGILLIQGINITPNKLLLNDCIYISNDYNEINHVIVKKGDILLGLNRPLINNQLKICLFDKDFAYLYQRAGILSFNKLKINSLFLYQYLQTDSFKKHLQVELVGSDQPYIKSNIFNKIKLIFPCLEEQTKIADFLSAFDRKLDNQKAQLEHWQQIKKGLLQQMFV